MIITPAVAGPFDLGNVVVWTALYLDPEIAQVSAVSDPIPHILEGIPLDVRDIRVYVDRPNFTLNPTSCEPFSVLATVFGSGGAVASLLNRFQVGGCAGLGFKPKLSLKLKGATKRNGNPALRAVVDYPGGPGYANIARAVVVLPHSEFLDQAHIRTVCTRVQFNAKQCPKGSIYGQARAVTPLLDEPLEGPVYLRSSSHLLPDLVVALSGPETLPVEINLVGRVDTKDGGLRTSFESVRRRPRQQVRLEHAGRPQGLARQQHEPVPKHPPRPC